MPDLPAGERASACPDLPRDRPAEGRRPRLEWLDSGRVDPERPPSPRTRWSEDHLCELASVVSRRPPSKSNTACIRFLETAASSACRRTRPRTMRRTAAERSPSVANGPPSDSPEAGDPQASGQATSGSRSWRKDSARTRTPSQGPFPPDAPRRHRCMWSGFARPRGWGMPERRCRFRISESEIKLPGRIRTPECVGRKAGHPFGEARTAPGDPEEFAHLPGKGTAPLHP